MLAIKIDVVEQRVREIELDDNDVLSSLRHELGCKVERAVARHYMFADYLFVDANPPAATTGWFTNPFFLSPYLRGDHQGEPVAAGHGIVVHKKGLRFSRQPKSGRFRLGYNWEPRIRFLERRKGQFYFANSSDTMRVIDEIEDREGLSAYIQKQFDEEQTDLDRRRAVALKFSSDQLKVLYEKLKLTGVEPGGRGHTWGIYQRGGQ